MAPGPGREINERFALGTYDDVLIILWFKTPTIEDFGAVESATTDLIGRKVGGIGLLIVIVEGNDKPPPNEVRRRNADLVARYQGKIWGMARVIEGAGLKSSMIRFALSTIDLLSNSNTPEKTMESVGSAVAWLSSMGRPVHERGVLNEVEKLRRGMPAPRGHERPAARAR
jgi:hypothetical protein